MISEIKINYLLDVLWYSMEYKEDIRRGIMQQYHLIEKQFIKHRLDFDTLLHELLKYDKIGPTIATGLIWVSYPNSVIPFDKFTTSYCIQKGYLRTPNVTDNYKAKCKKIIKDLKARPIPITVEEFVREARHEIETNAKVDKILCVVNPT